eukprot:TRINITY_DN12741_c0_g1_i1.p1 TRINITY_DN12741_c0_g1~~TRINITY_DN12741_c0_g1_i1.p1  ORF type:complete len:254 (-),score=37.28 TRINITY_DN12741_c0_g1_i1:12-773(-)
MELSREISISSHVLLATCDLSGGCRSLLSLTPSASLPVVETSYLYFADLPTEPAFSVHEDYKTSQNFVPQRVTVRTFKNAQGQAKVTLISVNVQVPESLSISFSSALVDFLIAHHVEQVEVLSSLHFPASSQSPTVFYAKIGDYPNGCLEQCAENMAALDALTALQAPSPENSLISALMHFLYLASIPSLFLCLRGYRIKKFGDDGTSKVVEKLGHLAVNLTDLVFDRQLLTHFEIHNISTLHDLQPNLHFYA